MDATEECLVAIGRPIVRLTLENARLTAKIADYERTLDDIRGIITEVYSLPTRMPTEAERRIFSHFVARCDVG